MPVPSAVRTCFVGRIKNGHSPPIAFDPRSRCDRDLISEEIALLFLPTRAMNGHDRNGQEKRNEREHNRYGKKKAKPTKRSMAKPTDCVVSGNVWPELITVYASPQNNSRRPSRCEYFGFQILNHPSP
jgi:hypothetical protein